MIETGTDTSGRASGDAHRQRTSVSSRGSVRGEPPGTSTVFGAARALRGGVGGLASFAVLTALLLTGCPQEIRGDGSDGGVDGSVAGGSDGGAGTDGGGTDACVPKSCAEAMNACGTVDDGCGGTLSCSCPFALTCGASDGGTAQACGCAATGFLSRVADTGAGYTGLYNSVAIDSSGMLHAVYVDGDDGFKYLRLATRAATYEPVIESVEKGVPITGTELVVDASGVVHVVYYRWSAVSSNIWDAEIWYARRGTNGAWTRSRVVTGGEMVYAQADDAAIALDASGTIHLLYYVFTYNHADLWHASSPNGTGWVTEQVAPGTDIGSTWSSAGSVSLRAAPDGTLVALYFDYASHQLKVSRKPANGAWTERSMPLATPANSGDWAGAFSSMAFDSAGTLHVSYSMETSTTSSLWYGTLTPADAFSAAQVDPAQGQSAKVGLYNALALDGAGRTHLSYYDSATADLKYAYQTDPGGPLQLEVAQTQGSVGSHAALAIDADGTAHALYFELVSEANMTGQLRYATRCR